MVLSVAGRDFPSSSRGVRGTFLSLLWGGGWQGGDKPSSPFPEAAASVALPPLRVSGAAGVRGCSLWPGMPPTAAPGAGGVLAAADAHGEWVMPVGSRLPQHIPGARGTHGMKASPAPSSAPGPRGSAHSPGSCGRSGVLPARGAVGLQQWGQALLPPLPRAALGWGHGEGRQC